MYAPARTDGPGNQEVEAAVAPLTISPNDLQQGSVLPIPEPQGSAGSYLLNPLWIYQHRNIQYGSSVRLLDWNLLVLLENLVDFFHLLDCGGFTGTCICQNIKLYILNNCTTIKLEKKMWIVVRNAWSQKKKITTSSREILVKIYKVDEKNQEILTEDVTIGMTQN